MGTNLLEELCKKFSENTVSHARALADVAPKNSAK
jgi:hypothetical protein